MHVKTKQLVMASLMASMVCVATMIIKIPSPMKGYINLGDCIVLLCGWLFAPGYAFAAAGLGSALADMFAGYMTYAPATFLIKGTMALIAGICMRLMSRRLGRLPAQIIGGVWAELIMILGYFLFEGMLYGFAPSAVNIPANGVQGVAGLMLGVALIKVFERLKISFE